MRHFPFKEKKALNAVLYILNKMQGSIDKHKLFKILYFADQKHLVTHGRPVVGEQYIKMQYGPVPSHIYDAIKSIRNNSEFYNFDLFTEALTVRGKHVISEQEPDLDELSKSDINCLNESIAENKDLSFSELVNKSHGTAYDNSRQSDRIRVTAIAQEGGANEDQIKYINENMMDLSHFLEHVTS